MEEKELRKSCAYYVMFIERAYGTYESDNPGLHAEKMRNLIVAENGKIISLEIVTDFELQLIEIKKTIEDALDRYMAKPNIPHDILSELKSYKDQVIWAVSSKELMKIVLNTIDLTVSIPIEMSYLQQEISTNRYQSGDNYI